MNNFFGFKNLLFSNIEVDKYSLEYRRTLLLDILSIAAFLLFFIFGFSYVISGNYKIGIIEIFASIMIAYALNNMRKTNKIELASSIIVYILFLALIALVSIKQASDFTLIWTIFMPLSIFISGSKKGLILSLVFYVIIFYISYMGIDVWLNGMWNLQSYIRFVLASLFLTVVLYFLELSLENAFEILDKIRAEEKEHMKQLTELSITDTLTGLYNRRHLDELFHANVLKAKKHNDFFCFFILDLDHFKQYNDTYGHNKGDDVLVSVSNVLKNNMRRKSDTAFRMGGEEFSCLIMSDDESKIYALIEKIRLEIQELNTVTASFGLCIINNFEHEDFDEMYKIADKFLYEAKDRGRNQVVGELVKLEKSICSL